MASLNSYTQTGYTKLYNLNVTAKDSFLKNPDLMAVTFTHLQFKDDEKYQCLLNAALICKDFLDVALDALWENLDSLVPLLKLLPALQVEKGAYVLSGKVSQEDLDRLLYYSQKVKSFVFQDTDKTPIHSSTYLRIAQLHSSALFPSLRRLRYVLRDTYHSHTFLSSFISPLLDSLEFINISGFEDTIVEPFLATLTSQMISRIVLQKGQMTVDTLKKSIVHFKHLRSLDLSDAVFMSDFVIWEVLGTLPHLASFSFKAFDPESYPAHAPANSNSQSGGPKYFDALECLLVKASLFLIQHLLSFIDSPFLNSIEIYPVETEYLLTPSLTIVASKWSQSLKRLYIGSSLRGKVRAPSNAISKSLMLLTDLHEMETFHLLRWNMEDMDDDVRRLVMSWPKLRNLKVLPLDQALLSVSTLRIIAESCPELRHLSIQYDTSAIPPFDISSKKTAHKLEVLTMGRSHLYTISLHSQIQMARHLDYIFPYLKSMETAPNDAVWYGISELVKLCQDFRRGQ